MQRTFDAVPDWEDTDLLPGSDLATVPVTAADWLEY